MEQNLIKQYERRYTMNNWKKVLLKTIIIVLAILCILIVSDISEWWHWEEWMEHIRNNHL